MDKAEKSFTTRDIDKIKKALQKASAKSLKGDDLIELTLQEYITIMKWGRWADNVLEVAEELHRQCNKN